MSKPQSADGVVYAYLRERERAGSPRAQSLTDQQGFAPRDECGACGAGKALAMNTAAIPKCKRCGSWWPIDAVETPRSGRRSKRSGARKANYDRALVELTTYGKWIEHAGDDGLVLRSVCERGRQATMKALGWSEYAVKRAVLRARRSIEAQMERAALLGETA